MAASESTSSHVVQDSADAAHATNNGQGPLQSYPAFPQPTHEHAEPAGQPPTRTRPESAHYRSTSPFQDISHHSVRTQGTNNSLFGSRRGHRYRDASVHSVRSLKSMLTVDGLPQADDLVFPELGPGLEIRQIGTTEDGHNPVFTIIDHTAEPGPARAATCRAALAAYFEKWKGGVDTPMPTDPPIDMFWSWVGAFISIAMIAVLQQYLTPEVHVQFLIASFGASAVLLFGTPQSKLAQPRNCIAGHLISAIIAIVIRLALKDVLWLSTALGMSLSLVAMQATQTVHPPGGASAVIAASVKVVGPWYGFRFVLTVLFGSMIMTGTALVINNISSRRRYPTFWW